MNLKKICTGVLVAVTLSGTMVFADPLSDQLQQQQQQLNQNKNQLNNIEDKREELEAQIQGLDIQIEETMSEIDGYNDQISQTEDKIKVIEVDLKKAEEDLQKQQDLLDKRVRALYKAGQNSYVEMILETENFSDLMSNLVNMQKIIQYDNKLVAEFKAKQEEINAKKLEIEQEKQNIVVLKQQSEEKLASIKDTMSQQTALIDQLKQQERTFASKVSEAQSQVNATLSQINSIRSSTQSYVPSRGAAQFSSNAVLAYASNFLGTKYVWGGTTPNPGFDCSGFTKYVYAHFGVSLGRTTKNQINDGVAVSRSELQPGDLVLFGTGGVPHHVGIYAGNNTYIHAPQTGDVVKVSAMNRSDFIIGRRVK